MTLRRAQRGDDDACRALVEMYQRPVFALLSRMLGSRRSAECEDLAQETFLQVFQSLARFSSLGPARLSTWILTIASRRAIDHMRRRRLSFEVLDPEMELAAPAAADDALRQRAVATALQRAIADLPPEYRAAFLLREYHGMEYGEISHSLGIEIGTVKSRLSRARAAVRAALQENDHA